MAILPPLPSFLVHKIGMLSDSYAGKNGDEGRHSYVFYLNQFMYIYIFLSAAYNRLVLLRGLLDTPAC